MQSAHLRVRGMDIMAGVYHNLRYSLHATTISIGQVHTHPVEEGCIKRFLTRLMSIVN